MWSAGRTTFPFLLDVVVEILYLRPVVPITAIFTKVPRDHYIAILSSSFSSLTDDLSPPQPRRAGR